MASAANARPAAAGWFLARLAAWYFFLLLLWLPLGAPYRGTLLRVGNLLAPALAARHDVQFQHYTKWKEIGAAETLDLAIIVGDPAWATANGKRHYVLAKAVSTLFQPFMATAFLLALVLASRLTWRQRALRGGIALGLLHAGFVLCVGIDVSHAIAGLPGAAGPSSGWGRTMLSVLHHSITDWPAGVLLAPLVLWALLCVPTGWLARATVTRPNG